MRVFVDFSPGWNPTRALRKRTVACWACQICFSWIYWPFPVSPDREKHIACKPLEIFPPLVFCCTGDIRGHWSVRSFGSRKTTKREKSRRQVWLGPLNCSSALLSWISTWMSPLCYGLWYVSETGSSFNVQMAGHWPFLLLPHSLHPPLFVCFCDTAPLHGRGQQESPVPTPISCTFHRELWNQWCSSVRCVWCLHFTTYSTVFPTTVIMPVLTALHSFKQCPPC